MSLPTLYRYQVKNDTGVPLDTSEGTEITIKRKRQDLKTDGSWADETETGQTIFTLSDVGDLANGAFRASSNQDHSGATNRWVGSQIEVTATIGNGAGQSTPDGDILVRRQVSIDGGTTWEDDGEGLLIFVENFTAKNVTVRRVPTIGVS